LLPLFSPWCIYASCFTRTGRPWIDVTLCLTFFNIGSEILFILWDINFIKAYVLKYNLRFLVISNIHIRLMFNCLFILLVPGSRTSLSQNRAFAVVGPALWNDTPALVVWCYRRYYLRLYVVWRLFCSPACSLWPNTVELAAGRA